MKKILIFLIAVFSLPALGFGKDFQSMTPMEKGKMYFQYKDYGQAYHAFYQAFMADPTNLNISFFMGRAAFEQAMLARMQGDAELAQRRLEAALMAFDRVLIIQPGAIRVKLEIARCHMELGSLELAKQHFYEVLATNPPDSVKDNIELLLAQIASVEKQHFFSGMVSMGLSNDDNVRSGPPEGTPVVIIGVLPPFTAGAQEKDQIINNTVLFNHVYRFSDSPYSWKTSTTIFNSLYEDYRDLDLAMVGISTGPSYQGERFLLSANVHVNNINLAWDEYVRPYGVGASLTYLFDPRLIISSSLSMEEKGYSKAADDPKDATNALLSLNPTLILDDNRFTFNLAFEQEKAVADYWSYDKISWGIRYDRVLPKNFTAYVSFDAKSTEYEAANTPLTDTIARSDKVHVYSFGLSKVFWQSKNKSRNLSLQISHTVTDAKSNIDRSNYNKKVFASLLSYTF